MDHTIDRGARFLDRIHKNVCYLIKQTGWRLEYVHKLEFEDFYELIDGFIEIDPTREKKSGKKGNANVVNMLKGR